LSWILVDLSGLRTSWLVRRGSSWAEQLRPWQLEERLRMVGAALVWKGTWRRWPAADSVRGVGLALDCGSGEEEMEQEEGERVMLEDEEEMVEER